MLEVMTDFPWFVLAVVSSALLSALAWHLGARGCKKPVRFWSGVSLAALFIAYHPLSWIPAGYALGLGVGMAGAHGTPTSSFYAFSAVSSVVSGAMAWGLTHLLTRMISAMCEFKLGRA